MQHRTSTSATITADQKGRCEHCQQKTAVATVAHQHGRYMRCTSCGHCWSEIDSDPPEVPRWLLVSARSQVR